MDLRQATDIAKHLHDAADAIDRASAIILALEQQDRAALADPLSEIVSALHFQLLRAVYDRYPDLRPPAERRARHRFDICDGRTLCSPHPCPRPTWTS